MCTAILIGSRLTQMIDPNNRVLIYGYDGNTLDNAIGRVDYLANANGGKRGHHAASGGLQLPGLSTIVGQADGNGIALTTTLDAYGRMAELIT